jgi:hypothetical protein
MSLKEKYGLSEHQIKALYQDGKLYSTAYKADQILASYNQKLNSGLTNNEIILSIADEFKTSDSWVRRLLREAMK